MSGIVDRATQIPSAVGRVAIPLAPRRGVGLGGLAAVGLLVVGALVIRAAAVAVCHVGGQEPFSHRRVWNATDNAWQQSQAIDAGDNLLRVDGGAVGVVGLDWTAPTTAKVFNLTVSDIHTYYVLAGTTPVLVHNTSCYTWAKSDVDTSILRSGEGWDPSQGTPVLGRLWDTRVGGSWPGHTRIDVDPWTLQKNDAYIQTIINQRGSVYVGSPTQRNYWNVDRAEPTVYAREVQQLLQAGYKWAGDYLVPGS